MLRDLLSKQLEYASAHENSDEFHSAEQNARLIAGKEVLYYIDPCIHRVFARASISNLLCRVVDAERYYRPMYYSNAKSWNRRDTHMFETLVRVLKPKRQKLQGYYLGT